MSTNTEFDADLILKNCRIISVYTGDIIGSDLAIRGSKIIGWGKEYTAPQSMDLSGKYVAPGLIDSHVHIESAMVPPTEFAKAVVPRGITTVIADPHEIGNVLGLDGIKYMLDMSEDIPLSVFVDMPSCVPSSDLETSGAILEWAELSTLIDHPRVIGLGEVMNFPAVLSDDPKMMAKIKGFGGMPIDGHCPGLSGKDLHKYVYSGIGSDHECVTTREAIEKLNAGMRIFIREATGAKNLDALLPMITEKNARFLCWCTDDRQPADLLSEGSIDFMIQSAIEKGLDPIIAIQMATINSAEYFRLHDRGAIAPGKLADLFIFSDLDHPKAEMVFRAGKLVAKDQVLVTAPKRSEHISLGSSMHVGSEKIDLKVPATENKIRVIEVLPDQLITKHIITDTTSEDGYIVSDIERDIVKIAVVERHFGTGNIGIGFVHGFGLQKGAIASTIAHDHHNLVAIGVDDASMEKAISTLVEMGGGMVAVDGDEVLASVALPIAGLMTYEPIQDLKIKIDQLISQAKTLGATMHDPFMTMSFLALPVIPALKITDRGLVDVNKFTHVPLVV